MRDAHKEVTMGVRPYTDITVKFNKDFSPEDSAFPDEIKLGVKDTAKEIKIQNPLGLCAPYELHIDLTRAQRHQVLGEFRDLDIVQAVSDALGDNWQACNVRLNVR